MHVRFPEATTFHYMWTAVEDNILEAWVSYLRRQDYQHISLHYDGVRIDNRGADVQEICTSSAAAIEAPRLCHARGTRRARTVVCVYGN